MSNNEFRFGRIEVRRRERASGGYNDYLCIVGEDGKTDLSSCIDMGGTELTDVLMDELESAYRRAELQKGV